MGRKSQKEITEQRIRNGVKISSVEAKRAFSKDKPKKYATKDKPN